MRFKSVLRFCSLPSRPSCQDSVSYKLERSLHCSSLNTETQRSVMKHYSIARSQQGASTLVLALFVIAILVTAIVALVFGHKLGYQRGYYSMQNETQQAVITSKESLQ